MLQHRPPCALPWVTKACGRPIESPAGPAPPPPPLNCCRRRPPAFVQTEGTYTAFVAGLVPHRGVFDYTQGQIGTELRPMSSWGWVLPSRALSSRLLATGRSSVHTSLDALSWMPARRSLMYMQARWEPKATAKRAFRSGSTKAFPQTKCETLHSSRQHQCKVRERDGMLACLSGRAWPRA